MIIDKIQNKSEAFSYKEYFYSRARDAMFDFVKYCVEKGYKEILIPGYIGWSSKEGSGIFDPLKAIDNLKKTYYLMDQELQIDKADLLTKVHSKAIVLVVNYFGFRDRKIEGIINELRRDDVIIIEDNAHGFYTYHQEQLIDVDAAFFSLHKMLPFSVGGSLIIHRSDLVKEFNINRSIDIAYNPYSYHHQMISSCRRANFMQLYDSMKSSFYSPLRTLEDIKINVPQTFPILIKKGNRDKIYEILNSQGYGVVSLYHTLIDELQHETYTESLYVSKHILNLPLHQDVDSEYYTEMIKLLNKSCLETGDACD